MSEFNHKEMLLILLALGGLGALIAGQDRLKSGFLFFIGTLGLGYRTLPVTPFLKVHPGEVVLWLLLAYRLQAGPWVLRLPKWLWLFIPFWVLAWVPGFENGYSWDRQLGECRNFLVLVPLIAVATAVLARRSAWRSVVATLYGVSLWIATMGILEYVFPGIRDAFPGFVGDPSPTVAADGFTRANFSFWGGPHATFVCVLAMPLTALVWRWWPGPWQRTGTALGLALQVTAVYIAGYRSMWLTMGVLFLLFAVVQRRYGLAAGVLLLVLLGYQTLPEATQERLHSLTMVLRGQAIDSSGIKRWQRATESIAVVLDHPLGCGWGAAGWVHSDFLQVAVNLGLLPGLIFAVGYASTLWRLGTQVRRRRWTWVGDTDGFPLFLSFVAAGAILAVEGVQVLPQTILPVWLVWALVETWLQRASTSQSRAAGRVETLS